MPDATSLVIVSTTYGSEDDAVRAARRLLGRRLAACVQMLPVRSFFVWEGKAQDNPEWLLLIKTSGDLKTELMHDIRSEHPYETPEIIVTKVDDVDADYLSWAVRSTGRI